jgi:ribosome-associated protein
MSELVDYTDAFVLCSARNPRQVRAIAEEVRRVAKRDLQISIINIEGLKACRWVLVDVGSVIVHIFEQPFRGFYNLEGLWNDAPRFPLPESAVEEAFP